MMMSFIVKEVSGTINHLESAAILNYEMYSIFPKTRTNRGNRCRKKNDLCMEGCLRAILQESEAKLEMKIFNPPSIFVWR